MTVGYTGIIATITGIPSTVVPGHPAVDATVCVGDITFGVTLLEDSQGNFVTWGDCLDHWCARPDQFDAAVKLLGVTRGEVLGGIEWSTTQAVLRLGDGVFQNR